MNFKIICFIDLYCYCLKVEGWGDRGHFSKQIKEFDILLSIESTKRLYKIHEVNIDSTMKLRKIKLPGFIVLIFNEPIVK